jgi:hypothetical protein
VFCVACHTSTMRNMPAPTVEQGTTCHRPSRFVVQDTLRGLQGGGGVLLLAGWRALCNGAGLAKQYVSIVRNPSAN